MTRNHAGRRSRLRRFKRMRAILSMRCHTCRRKLDPTFRWDKNRQPQCSRHF